MVREVGHSFGDTADRTTLYDANESTVAMP